MRKRRGGRDQTHRADRVTAGRTNGLPTAREVPIPITAPDRRVGYPDGGQGVGKPTPEPVASPNPARLTAGP
ncbi:MAG: hypothetical protein WCQ91_07545 [Planctomycetota bacterium]